MDLENSPSKKNKVLTILENGLMVQNMEKEKRFGRMEERLRENSRITKKMDMANSTGKISPIIMESLSKEKFTDWENIDGPMAIFTKVNGF